LNNDSPNDWLKFWSENQKTLFQAWVEGKPPPGAFRGEPPPMGDAMKQADQLSDLMRETMGQWANLSKEAWSQVGRFDADSMKKLFDPAEWKRAGSHFDLGLEKLTEGPTYATLVNDCGAVSGLPQKHRVTGLPYGSTSTAVPAWRTAGQDVTLPSLQPWLVT